MIGTYESINIDIDQAGNTYTKTRISKLTTLCHITSYISVRTELETLVLTYEHSIICLIYTAISVKIAKLGVTID